MASAVAVSLPTPSFVYLRCMFVFFGDAIKIKNKNKTGGTIDNLINEFVVSDFV